MTRVTGVSDNARCAGPGAHLSRREILQFLGALGITTLGTSFNACGNSDGNAVPTGPSSSSSPLAALRSLLRSSPDHLAARAEEVVSTKDPTQIARFVRDHFTVLPGIGRDNDPELATYSRWGAAGTLRSGAGSLRDRAELMVVLLGAAGIPAAVKAMKTPDSLTAAELYRPRANAFSVDRVDLDGVLNAAGNGGLASSNQASPPDGEAEFDAAVAAVLAASKNAVDALPQNELPVPSSIPVVVAAPFGAAAVVLVAVGDQALAAIDPSTLTDAPAADLPKFSITVSAFMNPPAGGGSPSLVEIVKGSWPIDQVAGHQAQIVFLPPQGAKALLGAPLSSQHVRVPMIRIQPRPGVDLDPHANAIALPDAGGAAGPSFTAVGTPFTIDGELVTETSTSPDAQFLVLDDAARASATTRVATITGTVNAKAFPTVELDLSIADALGASVDGLGAGDLVVTESGKPMPITLVANRALERRPRVLISYDASGSLTGFWPTPAARLAFEQNLATILTDVAKTHPFDIQVVGLAGSVPDAGWVAPTVDGVAAAMENAQSLSDVWQTFAGGAIDSGPAVIIMVSDFDDPDPTYVDAAKKRLTRSGIPVIALTVGTVNEAVVSQVVAVSSGQRFSADAANLADTVGAIVDKAVAQKAGMAYRIRYDAPETGGTPRSVTAGLARDPSIAAALTYDVPAQGDRIAPPSVVAVYLTIGFGNVTERRRLGGASVTDRGTPLDDIDDPNVVADARSVLNGMTTIAIEPANPTLSAVLDDIVLAHQSLQPWHDVWSTDDVDAFARAAARSYRYPGAFAALLPAAPPTDGAPVVVPRGLRIAILTERARGNAFVRQIDLPPRLNAMRALRGGAVDLEAVVRASLRLSANESNVFSVTAYAQLAKRALDVAKRYENLPSSVLAAYGSKPSDAKNIANVTGDYSDLARLVPSDGGAVAFWVVDPESGSVAAIDASGRGGGDTSSDYTLFDALNLAIFVVGLGCTVGIVPYPWFCVGLTVASIAMTVAAILSGPVNAGTPFGLFSSLSGATMSFAKVPPFGGGSVGVALVVIILFLIAAEQSD
jgi:hypothetical protein